MSEAVGIRGIGRFGLVLSSAAALLLAGVIMSLYNEHAFQTQKTRETEVQAHILGDTVATALGFSVKTDAGQTVDFRPETQEYVDALKSNPEIEAVGVYDADGDLVASFAKAEALPRRFPSALRTAFVHRSALVVEPVHQGRQLVGDIILRTRPEPWGALLGRYSGAGLLLLMGLLVVTVLGAAQDDLKRANRELKRRAEALTSANEALQVQMAEREKAEAALRQSQKMEAIGRLTGGVAHDFNNLLMVASSGLELMDRTEDPARRQMLKEGVRSAVKRGADLTRQLLAFARRNPLKPEVIDPGQRVEGLKLLLERSLRDGVALELELEPGLWPVEIDAGQLEVALINIAVNARDAMPEGGSLGIRAQNLEGVKEIGLNGDFVRISCADTGSGIPPELLASVFEPFFTTKGVGKGTGLGLSQVYGFCRSSGGDVRIESEVGSGTTVHLYIPRSPKPLPSRNVEPPQKALTKKAGRVLLVEDDADVAEVVAGMFQSLGWEPLRVADGPSALTQLDGARAFDLMFSDMVMPGGIGGLDLAREAAKRRPGLKVILTTGFSEAAQAAAEEGMRVLPKPYDIAALTAELENLVRTGAATAPKRSARREAKA